jgi:myo-inositol-1(or 4)-monophosphatase
MLQRELAFARELGARAGALLLEGAFAAHAADRKATSVDLVTDFDRRSEALIVTALAAEFPDDQIVAEEGGGSRHSPDAGAQRRWLVDPLDGTTNFSHGLPFFCVSIGLEVAGRAEVGVVVAPALGWHFSAARGGGAFLGERRLAVSRTAALGDALLATGFPYDSATSPRNNFGPFVHLYKQTQGIRRVGAAALDLCMVAAGWLDGFWELSLKPWDTAAGVVLVEEAGGRVSDWHGAPRARDSDEVVATNGHLHAALLASLGGAPTL